MENIELIEEWRPVKDWEDLYMVSSLGMVKSLDRETINSFGIKRKYAGKILSQDHGGKYVHISLQLKGKVSIRSVHVVVATAFHGERPNGMEVMHLNNNKRDNRASNLKWGTHQENIDASIRDGLYWVPIGWERPNAKHKKATYRRAYKLWNSGKYNKDQIGRIIGVSSGTIHNWLQIYEKNKIRINAIIDIK